MRILDGLVLRKLCGEYIVTGDALSRIDFCKVVSLNETAAYLWEALQGRDFVPEDMAALLTARYDVDEARALEDARTLVKSWQEAGLVAE